MLKFLLLYLFLINAAGFLLMLEDKRRARKKLRRISEATLMGAAALGGGIGCLTGMYAVRHKTLHLKFTVGIPFLIAAQVILAVILRLATE